MILLDQDGYENAETIKRITYPHAGDVADYCLTSHESIQNNLIHDPWAPFSCEEHFNFAAFLKRIKCPSHEIDKLLKAKMPLDASLSKSFRSAYTFNKRVEQVSDGLGWQSWKKVKSACTWTENGPSITFYHRDPLECTQWILGQVVFGKHMTFMPIQNYHGGIRHYDDMNTAEWWWETQVTND